MKDKDQISSENQADKNEQGQSGELSFQVMIENLMKEIVGSGNYESACLFNEEGLPLSQYAGQQSWSDLRTVRISLMMQEVQKTIKSIAGLQQIKEIMVEDADAKKIVFRFITFFGQTAILVVVVPSRKSYRGLTNRLATLIAKLGRISEEKEEGT
jgi:hypothetical protein